MPKQICDYVHKIVFILAIGICLRGEVHLLVPLHDFIAEDV